MVKAGDDSKSVCFGIEKALLGLLIPLGILHHPAGAATLTWEQHDGCQAAALPVPKVGQAGFVSLDARAAGIDFTNCYRSADLERNSNLMNGSGVAFGDFDGDGLCDLFFCGMTTTNRLYRNLGNWRFEDVTAPAGVAGIGRISRGAAFADVNGDRQLDLVVSTFGGPSVCYLNRGHGKFEEKQLPPGVTTNPGSTSLALGDLDGNGTVDLYLLNFGEIAILRDGAKISTRMVHGQPVVSGRYAQRIKILDGKMVELGEPDVLYLNDGQGNFTPVSWTEGRFLDEHGRPMLPPWDFGLSVQIRDVNEDGFPDIYVCNDFQTPDRVWLNNGKGYFRALNLQAFGHTSQASMGVDFADIDRDGCLDFLVVEMLSRDHRDRIRQRSSIVQPSAGLGDVGNVPQIPRNTLYWNRGDGTYAEIADYAGVAASDWSWQPVFLDVDLDGYEDVLIVNGISHDLNHMDYEGRMRGPQGMNWKTALPPFRTPHVAYRNRGDLTFEDTSLTWGFNAREIGNGMAAGDLDNDGDWDVVINCLDGGPLILRNESLAPRLAVRLKGRAPNTQGIGARIKVWGGPVSQDQEIIAGGYYLSSPQALRVFAAGSLTNRMTIEVTWRSGLRSVLSNALPNHIYEVDEARAQATREPAVSAQRVEGQAYFRDVSELLAHTHHDDPFDDFARQPLLPRRLSQLGPGVAWFDLDGDSHEDLILGSGRGGVPTVCRSDGKGGFTKVTPASTPPLSDDLTGLAGWIGPSGQRAVLAGMANYETGSPTPGTLVSCQLQDARLIVTPQSGVRISDSMGPLAVADYDADGDLDLFIGGRVIPGRYPEAASSRLYRNAEGQLQLDGPNSQLLEQAGLVGGAVFSDLNGDGWPELVLACEWGPLRVFQNDRGKFREITATVGLDRHVGWWAGVTAGDLDGDGRLDLIASNWGLNSPYLATSAQPEHVFFFDDPREHRLHLLEARFDTGLGELVPRRNLLDVGAQLPFVRARFPTHQAYSKASLAEILGDSFQQAKHLQAGTLASTLFLNRSGNFVAEALPSEAQLAPAFGICVADMDGDGNEDVFLSQNFFAVWAELPRLDAGCGLWLRGDGTGKLTAVSTLESGIKVSGEQRGAATGDFNRDGRVDLVITQNRGATKLYRNMKAKPGLRVRLQGPPGNPHGIGAVLRLLSDRKSGPVREVHGGSGYWSQDSVIQVLSPPSVSGEIWVRWPGGKTTRTVLPAGAAEIAVSVDGGVKAVR